MSKALLSIFFTLLSIFLFAQGESNVYGKITDEEGNILVDVNIIILGQSGVGTTSDKFGNYILEVPSGTQLTIVFKYVGFQDFLKKFILEEGRSYRLNPIMESISFDEVEIRDRRTREDFVTIIPVDELEYIPDISGDPIMAALKQMGAVSNNELSSQYSVRGGNFDENLIFVNDFEIYRPQFVRTGQQEGFSFPNYNLTRNISFSAGGFEAKYGDKLSSVLDIRYKKPQSFHASLNLSLLGGQFHIEAANKDTSMGILLGVRQKSNQYILNSLQTSGEYQPSFTDIQALVNFRLSKKLDLEVLGNYNRNQFRFQPESRVTSTGVVNNVVQLEVFFEGQELDIYNTGMLGVSFHHRPNGRLGLKWLASSYQAFEQENFDIIGDYFLGAVESNLGDEGFGDILFGLGVGTYQDYARNTIESWVSNVGHKGYYELPGHFIEWGSRIQYEQISDKISEWERLDSAGYSLPFSDSEVFLNEVIKSESDISSIRLNGFFQDTWVPNGGYSPVTFVGGARFNYWDLNREFVFNPRMQVSFRPFWLDKDSIPRDIVLKAAVGMYSQPPFYRELRDQKGNVNTEAQKSIHFLLGANINFKSWNRDFKFVTEVYYKYLYDLVPYEYENVRILYFGDNLSKGYSAGIDLRLFGELVEDAESWVSLSFLKTNETIETFTDAEGNVLEIGTVARPTDQRVNFGMYFQDYMLRNKNFKVHLNFLFGTGLPFGPPQNPELKSAFRIPPYRRVDVGFSALLLGGDKKKEPQGFFRHFESIWASIEVFNLLGISNTISYIWVKDNSDVVYAFPNFLTSRRLNARLIIRM